MTPTLLLFARAPRPGAVKTRLAAGAGEAAAAGLYAAFLEDLAVALAPAEGYAPVLVHADEEPGPFLRALFAPPWQLWPQGPGGLGDRVVRTLRRALAGGAPAALAAGSDVPLLGPAEVEAALLGLRRGADVVVAPSPDGGFGLLGIRSGVPVEGLLAGVRWSSASAADDVARAASRLGRPVELLAPLADVDTLDDLLPLARRLASGTARAPRTAAALAGMGFL